MGRTGQVGAGCGRLIAAALAVLAGVCPAVAGPRVTVLRETRVTLDLRLDLFGEPRSVPVAERLVTGAGGIASLNRTIETSGAPLSLFLALTPDPDPRRERCRVRVVARIVRAGMLSSFDRVVEVGADRSTLVDIWGTPDGRTRLVMGLTAWWSSVPRIVELRPGTRPVEFALVTALRAGGRDTVLEERNLAGLVGSPIRYSAVQDTGSGETAEAVTIEITPHAIEEGQLDLAARVGIESGERREAMTRRSIALGESVELVLAAFDPGESLVFRITPYF